MNEFTSAGLPTVRLGNVLSLEYGSSLIEEERSGGEFPVMGSNGIVGYHDDYLVEAPCIIIGRKGSAGEVVYSEKPCYPIDTTFYVQLKTDDFYIKFVYYILRLLRLQRLSLFKGVPGLNRFDVYEAKLPIVAKQVQLEVINQIEPIEKQIAELMLTVSNINSPINNVMAKEFGFDVGELNKSKEIRVISTSISNVANNKDIRFSHKFHSNSGKYVTKFLNTITAKKIKDFLSEPIVLGASISPDFYDEDGEKYYVSMASIKNWSFDTETANKVTDEYFQSNHVKSIKQDDIIMARSGEGTIGKVALIENDTAEGIFCDFTMRIRVKNCMPRFAYYYFASDYFQHLVYVHKKGLGNNTNIFPVQLREFPMLDVSMEVQERVIAEVQDEVDNQNKIKAQIKQKQLDIDAIILKAILNQ